ELARFTPAEVRAQVTAILGDRQAAGLAGRIAERSDGNPYFKVKQEAPTPARPGLLPGMRNGRSAGRDRQAPCPGNMTTRTSVTTRPPSATTARRRLEPSGSRDAIRAVFSSRTRAA